MLGLESEETEKANALSDVNLEVGARLVPLSAFPPAPKHEKDPVSGTFFIAGERFGLMGNRAPVEWISPF